MTKDFFVHKIVPIVINVLLIAFFAFCIFYLISSNGSDTVQPQASYIGLVSIFEGVAVSVLISRILKLKSCWNLRKKYYVNKTKEI